MWPHLREPRVVSRSQHGNSAPACEFSHLKTCGDFPGGPKAKILHFQSRGPRFNLVVSLDLEKATMGVHCHRLTTSVGLKYFQSQKMREKKCGFPNFMVRCWSLNVKKKQGDFLGGPMDKTLRSQCRGPRFHP